MEDAVNKALQLIKDELPTDLGRTVMKHPLSLVDPAGAGSPMVFTVSDPVVLRKIRAQYAEPIRTRLKSIIGRDLDVEFRLVGEESPREAASDLNPHFLLSRFLRSKCNEIALDAALSVIEQPGKTSPLVITGDIGLGKTHLLQAMAHALKREHGVAPCMLSLSDFQEELLSALQAKKTLAIKEKYRKAGALFVDDVQFLKSAPEVVQEEFYHIFNFYSDRGCQIVLTCDRPVHQLAVSSRLMSRLTGGLGVVLQTPDRLLRRDILAARADEFGLQLSKGSVDEYTEDLEGNIRELESLSTHLFFLAGRGMNISDPEKVLNYLDNLTPASEPTADVPLERIVDVVCQKYSVTRPEMLGTSRRSEIALPRHVAMYLGVKYSGLNKSAIARYFRKSDHTTVISAQKKIARKMEKDTRFHVVLEAIVHDLRKSRG